MGSQDDMTVGKGNNGMAPERVSILITMIGFILMLTGLYLEKDIKTIYFNIGLAIVIMGVCFFALFIWARIYSLSHFPLPLPDSVKNLLLSGITRQQPQPEQKSTFNPRPAYQVSRTVGTQPLTQTAPAPAAPTPQPAAAAAPAFAPPASQPSVPEYQPVPAAVTNIPYQPASVPQPVDQVTSTAPVVAPGSVPSQEQEKPKEPTKQEYVDVLEEADREFESYIDKLIEE